MDTYYVLIFSNDNNNICIDWKTVIVFIMEGGGNNIIK